MPTESAEVSLASNPDDPALSNVIGSVTDKIWHACAFKPVLPPGATAFAIDSATFDIGKDPASTWHVDWRFEIRRLDAAGKPMSLGDGGLLDRVIIPVADVPQCPSGQFPPLFTVNFTNAKNLDPAQGVAILTALPAGAPGGFIGLQAGGTPNPADMAYWQSATSGGIWAAVTNRRPIIEVKGTYTMP